MSSELQSMKYMPAEFLASLDRPQVPGQSPENQSPYATTVSPVEQIGAHVEEGRWTSVMSFIAGFISFAGGIGIIQGLWALYGLFNLKSQIETMTELSRRMPELKDTLAVMEAQMANWNLMLVSIVIGLIVSVGFIFSSYMYKNRKENGHMLMAAFCGFSVLYLLTTVYITYLSLEGMPALQGEHGPAALAITMGTVGFIVLIKVGIYLGIAACMFTRNSKAIFAPRVAVNPAQADLEPGV